MKYIKKILGISSFYLLPAGLLLAVLAGAQSNDFFAKLGEISWYLVMINLFLKPVAVISKWKYLMFALGWRRELGVAAFWLFVFHATGLFITEPLEWSYFFIPGSYLIWGGAAGIGMLILGLTSNDIATKFLGKNWKRIQYIAYPVLFLITMHKYIATNDGPWPAIIIFAVFIGVKVAAAFISKRRMQAMAAARMTTAVSSSANPVIQDSETVKPEEPKS